MSNVNTSNTQVTPFVWGEISLSQTVMVDGAAPSVQVAASQFLATVPDTFSDVVLKIKLVPLLEVVK